MSIDSNNVKKVSELVDYINSNLQLAIQSKIVWHQGNLPPNFPVEWIGIFKNGNALTAISTNDIGKSNTRPTISTLYGGLQSLLLGWSTVKRLRFRYLDGSHGIYNVIYDNTQFANLSSGTIVVANAVPPDITNNNNNKYNSFTTKSTKSVTFQSDIFANTNNYKQSSNTLAVASTIKNLIGALYNTWSTLAVETWEYQTCHSNCHRNCHGSGGGR